jgi:hypothetical protein
VNLLPQNVDVVTSLGDIVFAELVKEAEHFEADVEAGVEYFLKGREGASLP